MTDTLERETTPGLTPPNIRVEGQTTAATERGLATAGLFGAMLVSSCCIAPLLLVTFGASGAWIGNLTALEPYKPYFLMGTAVLLGLGFRRVYLRPKKLCAEGSA